MSRLIGDRDTLAGRVCDTAVYTLGPSEHTVTRRISRSRKAHKPSAARRAAAGRGAGPQRRKRWPTGGGREWHAFDPAPMTH